MFLEETSETVATRESCESMCTRGWKSYTSFLCTASADFALSLVLL